MVKTSRKQSLEDEDIVGASSATFCATGLRDDVKEVMNDLFPLWACADEDRDDGAGSLRTTDARLRDSSRNTSNQLGAKNRNVSRRNAERRQEGPAHSDSDDDASSKIQGSKADTIDEGTYGEYDDESTMITREDDDDDDTVTLEGVVSKYSAIKSKSPSQHTDCARKVNTTMRGPRKRSAESDSLVNMGRSGETDDLTLSSDEGTYDERRGEGRNSRGKATKNKRKCDWRDSREDDETGSVFSDLESVESYIDSAYKQIEKTKKKDGKERRSKVGDPLGYVWDAVGAGALMNAMTSAIGYAGHAKSKGKKTNNAGEKETEQKSGHTLRSAMSKKAGHGSVVSFADTNEEIASPGIGGRIAKIVSFSDEDEEIGSVGKTNASHIQSAAQTGRDLSTLNSAEDDVIESVTSTVKTSSTIPTTYTTDFSPVKSVETRGRQPTVDTFAAERRIVKTPVQADKAEPPYRPTVQHTPEDSPPGDNWMNCGADAFFGAEDLYDRKGVLVTQSDLEENLQQLALFAVKNKHEVSGLGVDDAAWGKLDLERDIRFSVIIVSLPLGILFQENNGGCWVARIFASGNAAATTTGTGVEVGDQLAAINGKSTSRMSVDEVCRMVASVSNPQEIELTFIRYTGPLYPAILSPSATQRQSLLQNLPFHRKGPADQSIDPPPLPFIGRVDEMGQAESSPAANVRTGNNAGRRQLSDSYLRKSPRPQAKSTAQITSFRSLSPLTVGSRRSRSLDVQAYTDRPPLASKLEKAKDRPRTPSRPRSMTPLRTKTWGNGSSTPNRHTQQLQPQESALATPVRNPNKRQQQQSRVTTPKASGGASSMKPNVVHTPAIGGTTPKSPGANRKSSGVRKAQRKPSPSQRTSKRKGIIGLFRRPRSKAQAAL